MIILRKLAADSGSGSICNYIMADSLTGVADGDNQSFMVSEEYAAGKIEIIYNGQVLTSPADFEETGPAEITFVYLKPTDLSEFKANYQTDDCSGLERHGRAAIADQASTVTVNFTDLGHTNYTVNVTMENTVDSPPSVYAFIVSAKTSSSFTVVFMGDMDSANYYINWMIIED
jgi:hypothetical protein